MFSHPSSLSRTAITWLIAILVCLLLSAASLLDGPDDVATQQLLSDNEKIARKAAELDLMRERAAIQFCTRIEGSSATAAWGSDGALHCRRADKAIRQASLSI
jgi:hypothetical protein